MKISLYAGNPAIRILLVITPHIICAAGIGIPDALWTIPIETVTRSSLTYRLFNAAAKAGRQGIMRFIKRKNPVQKGMVM